MSRQCLIVRDMESPLGFIYEALPGNSPYNSLTILVFKKVDWPATLGQGPAVRGFHQCAGLMPFDEAADDGECKGENRGSTRAPTLRIQLLNRRIIPGLVYSISTLGYKHRAISGLYQDLELSSMLLLPANL